MFPKLKKLISLILSLSLILQQSVFAQTVSLNLANYLNQASLPVISDTFRPVHLRYLFYDSISNDFKLLIDKGDFLKELPGRQVIRSPEKQEKALESETQNLLRYFFIGLALPNDKFWVNLRPDAPENIIDDDLAQTDIGRIFLEADVQLKMDTASRTSPQTKEGKEYWDKLHNKAGELFGTENITIPTLTRPWIVPDEIILRESPDNSAYIYKATLKVMLEEDYLKSPSHKVTKSPANLEQYSFKDVRLQELNEYSTRLIKELIIPKLTREINSSKRYASLRQAYYSLILAQHFKNKFRNKSGPYSNLIDSRDLTNLTSQEPWDKRTYFREYQKSFQEGEYNLKTSQPTTYGQTVRRYMSGGVKLGNGGSSALIIPAKNNRITDHPEMLKVSSAIVPGNLKSAGRPTGSPMVVYVSKPEDLRISDNPEIKQIWNEMVEENLKLYEFTRALAGFSRKYGVIKEFPAEELATLRKLYDGLNQKDPVYNLGFITFNGGIKEGGGSLLSAQFKFNLLFLVSMVNAKIEPAELFNKVSNNTLLFDNGSLSKIATGRNLKEGEEYHYIWNNFKTMGILAWGGVNKKKIDKFFRSFESLLNIFQEELRPYHEIARVRYAGEKARMVILEQYRDQLRELVGFNSPREYIERQESVTPNTGEEEIRQVGILPGPRLPGETSGKVRKFRLANGQEVYAKRVNLLRTRYPEEEIAISREAAQSLKKISPYFDTQEFIGIVYDRGDFYLLSLAITGERNLSEKKEEPDDLYRFKTEVKNILIPLGLEDIEHIFIYKDGKIRCIFLDFETLPYSPVTNANDTPEAFKNSSAVEEEKLSALPKKIKEAEIEEILKTFSLNNPDWLGEGLKNKIIEDYGGVSVLEPIITNQYGQWNDDLRLSVEMMNELRARLNKEDWEYFYLPIITKHWIKVLTPQYWVNSYNYKVVIAKKPALEKALNYTYRNIVEGNDDVLFLWEFTLRPENEPPTIILEQQGLYKELRGQGFISEAYPLFVQCLAEKFPGWQVEGEFENLEKRETPPALALFKEYFLEPQSLYTGQDKSTPGYTESAIWKAKIPSLNSSSSLADNPGGVDLRALPITTQFLNHPLTANMPLSGSAVSLDINLDNELRQIQDMLKAGIMPSSERIREYALASSSLKPEDHSREIDRLLGCIADIFRLEEEKAKPTPQALKDALILLESDSPA